MARDHFSISMIIQALPLEIAGDAIECRRARADKEQGDGTDDQKSRSGSHGSRETPTVARRRGDGFSSSSRIASAMNMPAFRTDEGWRLLPVFAVREIVVMNFL